MKILLLLTFPLVILLTGVVCGQCPNFGKMASFHKEGLIKERVRFFSHTVDSA